MVLSDHTIEEEIAKGRMVVEALDAACIQRAGSDIHLDDELLVFKTWRHPLYIDIKENVDDLSELPLDLIEILARSVEC